MKPSEKEKVFDIQKIRSDFPILKRKVNGYPLVYLDNAASSQKPQVVIDAIVDYYSNYNANIHRGVHALSQEATDAYEQSRNKIQKHFNAAKPYEIIFTSGTTHSINLVANGFTTLLKAGDEIIVSALEHHSNIVPWQMLCEEKGARLRVAPIDDRGVLDLDAFEMLLGPRTKLVAIAHVSNALGTVNPVREITELAHAHGIPVLLDGAQAVAHQSVDVRALGCDFYAFSGHKLFGPTGIGVLYGRAELLEAMPPWQGGGDMIASVSFEKTTFNVLPYKFEAGTPHIAGVIGLGAALDYVQNVGLGPIAAWEEALLVHGTALLDAMPGVRLIGTAPQKASVLSFVLEGVHAHDVGTILDQEGIAIRTGHHCAQPVMDRFGVPATARASLAFYNTFEELDALASGLRRVIEVFA